MVFLTTLQKIFRLYNKSVIFFQNLEYFHTICNFGNANKFKNEKNCRRKSQRNIFIFIVQIFFPKFVKGNLWIFKLRQMAFCTINPLKYLSLSDELNAFLKFSLYFCGNMKIISIFIIPRIIYQIFPKYTNQAF